MSLSLQNKLKDESTQQGRKGHRVDACQAAPLTTQSPVSYGSNDKVVLFAHSFCFASLPACFCKVNSSIRRELTAWWHQIKAMHSPFIPTLQIEQNKSRSKDTQQKLDESTLRPAARASTVERAWTWLQINKFGEPLTRYLLFFLFSSKADRLPKPDPPRSAT